LHQKGTPVGVGRPETAPEGENPALECARLPGEHQFEGDNIRGHIAEPVREPAVKLSYNGDD